jgi:hypothetical protein
VEETKRERDIERKRPGEEGTEWKRQSVKESENGRDRVWKRQRVE